MLRSLESLIRLVGWQVHDLPGELDRENLPAVVLTACENVINVLAVGAGVLADDAPSVDTDADEFLTRLMGGAQS